MLAGQGGHLLIDIRPHHREAFSTLAINAMIRLMRRNSAATMATADYALRQPKRSCSALAWRT
jgi:hypothetical protein